MIETSYISTPAEPIRTSVRCSRQLSPAGVLFYEVSLMAALPYIQLYVADYLADTAHLTTEEHGAYLLLIFNYWQRGQPLNVSRLAAVARMSNERWATVERTLSEFFIVNDETWEHKRIEADLQRVNAQQTQRTQAGIASAKARKHAESTVVERSLNGRSTNTDTYTDKDTYTETDTKNKKRAKARVIRPEGVSQQIWDDFVIHREKCRATITETVIAGFQREADLAAISLTDAFRISCERGWRGFKAEWLQNGLNIPQAGNGKYTARTIQNAHNLRGWADEQP